jgi:hypothetical protein
MSSKQGPVLPRLALSRTQGFVTLYSSDLDGPRARQRAVARDASVPEWLSAFSRDVQSGLTVVAVAMGRARLGSTTRIRSIVIYPAAVSGHEVAYVYVEEREVKGTTARTAAPIHVVRCLALPRDVRFVETSPVSRNAPLRSV